MMSQKKYLLAIVFMLTAGMLSARQQAKYVFYFIGDGMGINQVLGAEIYRANLQGKSLDYDRFSFSEFPVNTFATNKSASSYVTDSSAAGTALASGHKTDNDMLGVLPDGVTPVNSIAYYAKKAGRKVGIASTVGINHATPAAFYGHNKSRDAYYEIGLQLAESNYDFFAAGGFLGESKDPEKMPYLKSVARDAGYTIAWGKEQYDKLKDSASKMILFQKDSLADSIPYAIDRDDSDLTLAQITESAIEFLMKDNAKGFFLMVEGGKIDYACHDNDVVTAYNEAIDFSQAIDVALEFYRRYPNQTLIVVTADHETGGLALGTAGIYELNYDVLALQDASRDAVSLELGELRINNDNNVSWEQVKELLGKHFGLWTKIPLTIKQEISIMQAYDESFGRGRRFYGTSIKPTVYEPVVIAALKVFHEHALVDFTSGAHTGTVVPVYAIGVGSQMFLTGGLDNTDLPKIISQASGYPLE